MRNSELSLDYQTPRTRVEKDRLNFLMNQYSKFQDEEISRLDFIKMVGYSLVLKLTYTCRAFKNHSWYLYLSLSSANRRLKNDQCTFINL